MTMIISVIIPTLNRGESLKRALLSLYNQISNDYTIEIVIIDDSPNNISSCVNELVSLLPEIPEKYIFFNVYVNHGEHGAANARNLGVKNSIGEFITFLDDDDVYIEGRLNSMYKFFIDSNEKYSFISSKRLYEKDNIADVLVKKQQVGVITEDINKYGNSIDIGIFLRKKTFLDVGGFDSSLIAFEDWDLILRLLRIKPCYKLNRYDYLVNDDSDRNRVSNNESISYELIAAKHRDIYGDDWYYRIISKGLSRKNQMTLIKCVSLVFESKNIIPVKYYLINKLIKIGLFNKIKKL